MDEKIKDQEVLLVKDQKDEKAMAISVIPLSFTNSVSNLSE